MLEHSVNPGKQIAGTIKSNRRQEFLFIDIGLFLGLRTIKTIERIILRYYCLSVCVMPVSEGV
jgi:hypothetical protein